MFLKKGIVANLEIEDTDVVVALEELELAQEWEVQDAEDPDVEVPDAEAPDAEAQDVKYFLLINNFKLLFINLWIGRRS